jgi:hypothetical protein
MSKVAHALIVQTTNHAPLALIGVGLIATVTWISAIAAFVFETVWSVLQASALL